jgi:DNA-binding CsgD family transcriptional regulator
VENNFRLSEADVRAMVRLLGETCALEGTINEKKYHLMRGLGELIDIQAWAWVHAVEMTPGELPVYVAYLHGGFTEEILAPFIKIQSNPEMGRMTTPLAQELVGRTTPLTRTMQQIVPEGEFEKYGVAAEWKACGIYPRCLSFHPLPDGTFSGLAMYRTCGKDFFTDREAKIVHIILSEVPWLHEAQGAAAERTMKVPQLPTRQRLALELLLQGYSRKVIADTMNISINTVSGYIKDIYRFFGVNSHPELINRFFLGNGGEK